MEKRRIIRRVIRREQPRQKDDLLSFLLSDRGARSLAESGVQVTSILM